jgi:transcriptional regulator GlxA family with amidase domain
LKIEPDHIFADAPAPPVIPAHNGSGAMRDWLKKVAPATDVTISVCTGAFHLAKAGLLNGKAATMHHEFLDKLEKQFPEIQVKREVRAARPARPPKQRDVRERLSGVERVEGEKISTAGGLTSGTDLALRVVERYFSREVAQKAADYMEYHGQGWIVPRRRSAASPETLIYVTHVCH